MKMITDTISNITLEIKTGKTPPTKNPEYFGEEINWYTPSDLDIEKTLGKSQRGITQKAFDDRKAVVFKPNTVLIGGIGDIGKLGITSTISSSNQQITGIFPNPKIVNYQYLFYWLKANKAVLVKNSTNAIVPILNNRQLGNIKITFPENIETQLHIANILSKAESLIAQRKESIRLLDEYLKSVFLEMFGESSLNKKKWPKIELRNFGKISTGNTPSRKDSENYSPKYIEWIKTDNIQDNHMVITQALEYLSEIGLSKARKIDKGALLVACIAGSIESIGRACITNRTVAFNQQINAIQPNKDFEPLFLYWLFRINRKYIQNHATKGMKKILTKGEFECIKMIKPPRELQNKFTQIVEKTEALKAQYQQSLQELENLYGSLSQKAFKGELSVKNENLLLAAEPNVEYKKEKIMLTKQEAFLRKLMLASHIINELCEEPTFGHTKLMKLLYLSEQVGGMALQTNYKKFAAGPFDGKTLTLIDLEYGKNGWFSIGKRNFAVNGKQRKATIYQRTEKSSLYKRYFDSYFAEEAEIINKLISLFAQEKTQTSEIVATLYYAWKEQKENNVLISEQSLIKGFYKFHKEKRKFTEGQIKEGYQFMMEHKIYPD